MSLREINAAAGQRNATALQYHFGDRHGLVRAIIEKHRPAVEAARHALLDEYEAAGVDDLRLLAGALVRPSAAKLADRDGGRAYLRIHAELVNTPDPPATEGSAHRRATASTGGAASSARFCPTSRCGACTTASPPSG